MMQTGGNVRTSFTYYPPLFFKDCQTKQYDMSKSAQASLLVVNLHGKNIQQTTLQKRNRDHHPLGVPHIVVLQYFYRLFWSFQ